MEIKSLFYKLGNNPLFKVSVLGVTGLTLLLSASMVNAQDIPADVVSTSATFGKITSLSGLFIWTANLIKYVGIAGVVIGVLSVIALLIYKLIASDDTETMKKVQSGITKAVIIVVLGFLLISAGFLITMIGNLLGVDESVVITITA